MGCLRNLSLSRSDWLAVLLSVLGIGIAFLIADRVFERMPHLEDEIAYVWQARVIASGHLTLPSPPEPKKFLVPFVVDYQGRRFGKYPLGWPALLAVGVWLGSRSLVNSLLAGLAIWLTYRLGKNLMGATVGLLGALLTLISPFFLMNVGSLLSHPFGLVLSLAFVIAWWDAFGKPGSSGRWLPTITAGLTLGALGLTRPFTALGVAFPFALHGLYLLVRGSWETRRRVLVLGGCALSLAALHFLWQYAATGDPLLNPYTLWWPYDKIGFGPGVGVTQHGHSLHTAWINTRFSLQAGYADLFGWGKYSWIFLPFGVWAARRNKMMLVTGSVFFNLLVFYMAYWIGSWLFGPRYQFEGLYSLTLLSAAGIAFLAGWPTNPGEPFRNYHGWKKARPLGVTALLVGLVALTVGVYAPMRVGGMRGLYGMNRARLAPFESPEAQALAPAVFIVHAEHWTEYGVLLELENPFLTSPFVFAFGDKPGFQATAQAMFPDRKVYHYFPDDPFVFVEMGN